MYVNSKEKEEELVSDFQKSIGKRRITVSIKEASELTGISQPTIFRYIQSGSLKSLKPTNDKRGRRVIHLRDLARFLIDV